METNGVSLGDGGEAHAPAVSQEDCPTCGGRWGPEWREAEACYAELNRRDGNAEYRAKQAYRYFHLALGACGVVLALCCWLFVQKSIVHTSLQIVQQDEQGRFIQQGVPIDLLAYTVPDGPYMEMLPQWVRAVRWRGLDTHKAKQVDWPWARGHTCPDAQKFLKDLEARDKPFEARKTQTMVHVQAVEKGAVQGQYHVKWDEHTSSTRKPDPDTTHHTATFTVGRVKPANLTLALDNRLGICVASFSNLDPQPTP